MSESLQPGTQEQPGRHVSGEAWDVLYPEAQGSRKNAGGRHRADVTPRPYAESLDDQDVFGAGKLELGEDDFHPVNPDLVSFDDTGLEDLNEDTDTTADDEILYETDFGAKPPMRDAESAAPSTTEAIVWQTDAGTKPEFAAPAPTEEEPVETVAKERGRHAGEMHEEITMHDRVENLSLLINHVLDQRTAAFETGDKSSSREDYTAVLEYLQQCQNEGLDATVAAAMGQMFKRSYEIISENVQNTDPNHTGKHVAEVAEVETEAPAPEVLADAPEAKFSVGDHVGIWVEGDEYDAGWDVVSRQLMDASGDNPAYFAYSINRDDVTKDGLNEGQLAFEKDLVFDQPESEEEPAPEIEAAPTNEKPAESEEDAGETDETAEATEESAPKSAAEAVDKVGIPEGIAPAPTMFESLSKREANLTPAQAAEVKKPFGMNFWKKRWGKLGAAAEGWRKDLLLGAAASVASVAEGMKGYGLGDDKQLENGPALAELPKDVFKVRTSETPTWMVNQLGYSTDKWSLIAESMNRDFPEYFEKVGKDIRFNHVGTLPKRVQWAMVNRLKETEKHD